jgi:hypothetical protein
VTLNAGGKSDERMLVVQLDPRIAIDPVDLVEQLRLTQAIDSVLASACAARDAAAQAMRAGSAVMPPALADSLTAITGPGAASLAGVADALSELANAVQAADAGPTQGMREAFAACEALARSLIVRWDRTETSLARGGR